MSPIVYYILHVGSLFVLAGYTFYAFGAAPETKKRVKAEYERIQSLKGKA